MNGANSPGVSWRWWSLSSKSGSTKPLKREMSDGSIGLVFTPDALVEIHHPEGNRNNNRYINLTAVHRHCHDQIHGGKKINSLKG
jgi:hypothetical protein